MSAIEMMMLSRGYAQGTMQKEEDEEEEDNKRNEKKVERTGESCGTGVHVGGRGAAVNVSGGWKGLPGGSKGGSKSGGAKCKPNFLDMYEREGQRYYNTSRAMETNLFHQGQINTDAFKKEEENTEKMIAPPVSVALNNRHTTFVSPDAAMFQLSEQDRMIASKIKFPNTNLEIEKWGIDVPKAGDPRLHLIPCFAAKNIQPADKPPLTLANTFAGFPTTQQANMEEIAAFPLDVQYTIDIESSLTNSSSKNKPKLLLPDNMEQCEVGGYLNHFQQNSINESMFPESFHDCNQTIDEATLARYKEFQKRIKDKNTTYTNDYEQNELRKQIAKQNNQKTAYIPSINPSNQPLGFWNYSKTSRQIPESLSFVTSR